MHAWTSVWPVMTTWLLRNDTCHAEDEKSDNLEHLEHHFTCFLKYLLIASNFSPTGRRRPNGVVVHFVCLCQLGIHFWTEATRCATVSACDGPRNRGGTSA